MLAQMTKTQIETFDSLKAWETYRRSHPEVHDAKYIRSIIDYALEHGVHSDVLGDIAPEEVVVHDANYRESLMARGFNPRQRAVLDLVAEHPLASDAVNFRIYAPEALTPLALILRGRFARFHGSEFAETVEQRRDLFPIAFEDLGRLSLPSGRFDLVLSNEVFEHVPDLDAALSELARVLRPEGMMIATFPFAYNHDHTIRKAWFQDGQLCSDGPPEYHGNPVDPERGSLVFQIPGWDILHRVRSAGFRSAVIRFISSHERGITGSEIAGIHVLVATR